MTRKFPLEKTRGGWAHQGLDPRSVGPRLGRLCSEAPARLGGARPAVFGRTGLAISLTVIGFNLLGDAVRELFDPRSEARTLVA